LAWDNLPIIAILLLLSPTANLMSGISAAVILSLCCTTYPLWRCRLIGTVYAIDLFVLNNPPTMGLQCYRYSIHCWWPDRAHSHFEHEALLQPVHLPL